MMRRRLGDDRGSVVAEFAVALPAVVLVLAPRRRQRSAPCARQVRLQDAAADAARLAARGEPADRVHAASSRRGAGRVGADRAARRPRLRDRVGTGAALPSRSRATSCALAGGL